MFKKILIANRGEIALRVICACKELGIKTVAVFSEADRHALHVKFSDEAVCIGPARIKDSYLNIPSVIGTAEITNVDAIHPGYGFLAESAYFAEVCEASKIKFIGPSAESIRMMGDKARAREEMGKLGLPCCRAAAEPSRAKRKPSLPPTKSAIPSSSKPLPAAVDEECASYATGKILPWPFKQPKPRRQTAFGVPDCYIEKYIDRARHIEFQIMADEHGNVVHLGERECSIQRRHQKLIEESPSVIMTPQLRTEMGEKVVRAIKSVGYSNAGTLEFLVDENRKFYFMEMNTRVQVEHPVTERITGIDIVRDQILIAAGEKLAYRQQDIEFRGHVMECRINAEDPVTCRPSPGKIRTWHPPCGFGVRVDTAAYAEYVIPPYYDSLIAKLIVYGVDRAEAINRMRRALDMFIVEGVNTSIPLHQKILAHPDFQSGDIYTAFLEHMNEPRKNRGIA